MDPSIVTWDDFCSRVSYLLPQKLTDKMGVVLRAVAPSNLTDAEFERYEFSQDEIASICHGALMTMAFT
jgi:hypothetical protein